ncbi:MAG: hypothetical protein LBH07_05965, partial [Treponema sp.]|nr:hypothetical protein [Treponema sp.]
AHAAEESIKEAMLITQNENAGRGLARIYRLFSLVQLTNNLFSEAIDYFSFAVENAHKSNDTAELGISSYYAAVAHFIFGNISKALSLAEEARTASLDAVLPGWADRSRFLKGRLYFETGLYEKALDIFEELKSGPYGSITEDFTNTVNAWIYRSGVFIDHKARTETVKLAGFDAKLFRAEAAFIEGKYKKVLELINKVDNSEMDEDMILIEQSDWRSGFYQCELLLFPLHNLKNRMINTLRVLSHCYLNKEEDRTEVTGGEPADFQSGIAKAHPTGYTGGSEEAIREMQWIMRDDLPEKDPNGSFYLYSYYQLLKQTGAQEVDMNTAISIAFKRLQKRASRIEDADIKRSFLSTHYWNSALTAAAKEHKLM